MDVAVKSTPRLRLTRYPTNTYDLLKAIAVLAMVADHGGVYLWPEQLWWRVVGRIAFPLFLFLVGYSGQQRVTASLLAMATIVSLLDYADSGTVFPLNILWAIALTRWYLGRSSLTTTYAHLLPLMLAWPFIAPVLAYGTTPLLVGIAGAGLRHALSTVSKTVLGLTLLFHCITQLVSFDFSLGQQLGTSAVIILLGTVLYRFQMHPLPLPRWIVWLSRYALEVYVLHLAGLMLIHHLLETL